MFQKKKCNCKETVSTDLIAALVFAALFMPFGGSSKPTTTINIYTDKSIEVKND